MKLEAQIQLVPSGKWHRRVGNTTRCGEPVLGAFISRDAPLGENPCEQCYTASERLLVMAEEIQRANDLDAEAYYSGDTPTDVDEVSSFDAEEATDVFEP